VFCVTGLPLVESGSLPRTDGLGRREAIISIYHPWRIARAHIGPPMLPVGNVMIPVRVGRLPVSPERGNGAGGKLVKGHAKNLPRGQPQTCGHVERVCCEEGLLL
jgi:hypothetical protein